MMRTVVVRGHVVGPKVVELDSPVPPGTEQAEVVLRVPDRTARKKLSEILRELPPGMRTVADIEEQIEDERRSWDE